MTSPRATPTRTSQASRRSSRASCPSPRSSGRAAPRSGVFVAALTVRLFYNLALHPPLDFATSDMGGYLRRGAAVLDVSWSARDPWASFFPPGTHLLVAAVQGAFGRGKAPIGVAWALLGAGVAAYGYALAERLMRGARHRATLASGVPSPWGAESFGSAVVAVVLVLDLHQILLGGFVLSEVPFSFALVAGTFHLLRHDDERRPLDAAAAGVAFALASSIRPQALLSVALVTLVLLRSLRAEAPARPRSWPHLALFLAPVVLTVSLAAVRVRHHTGSLGVISTNGSFNLVFGRCHCETLSARDRGARFTVPVFSELRRLEARGVVVPLMRLAPAKGLELRVEGGIADEAAMRALAADCVKATGPLRQVGYSLTHVLLLWVLNIPFPTTGVWPNVGAVVHVLWVPGALAALARSLRRGHERLALVAAHLWALLVTAVVFFGESRMRVPYDAIGVALGAAVTTDWIATWRRGRADRGRA